ncbi:hypothetical protein [Desulfolucanica intricata]|uniref:hypothetical protein n=1 Tax=Desulfolucanica intricata TaxID=1285191 RepID=UPI00082D95A0|nr:hypothetical protein [Desulfolucanica intricata]
MAVSTRFNFATGVTVNIVTTRQNFTGELIDEVFFDDNSNNTNNNNNNDNNGISSFLIIRLTAASAPFVTGQVVRINTDEIIAIG